MMHRNQSKLRITDEAKAIMLGRIAGRASQTIPQKPSTEEKEEQLGGRGGKGQGEDQSVEHIFGPDG
jgi:hypothetical protein